MCARERERGRHTASKWCMVTGLRAKVSNGYGDGDGDEGDFGIVAGCAAC